MGIFIPPNKLENLKLYKYSSEDHSLISRYILKRWWNGFVQIFPMSMAPNVITLLGLMFVLANLMCVFYFDPYLDTPSPRWCYLFYAFGLFMYQTFDGCDGCHARRTSQSGPLGELFDHSIDAINTTLACIVFGSVFQLGYGWIMMISQFLSVCNFYTSTWEEYHTHTLYLSEFSGPVEGILMICSCYLITAITGPGIWDLHLCDIDLTSFGHGLGVYRVLSSIFYMFAGMALLYFNIASAMKNVRKKYSAESRLLPKAVREQIRTAYKGLVPFFAYYASVMLLVYNYPETVSKYGFPLIISIGLTVAFSVGRIILAHLTLQDFPFIQVPAFVPLLELIIAKLMIGVYGYDRALVIGALVWSSVGLTLGIHGMFVAEVITEITTYLDIYALSIKHKKV